MNPPFGFDLAMANGGGGSGPFMLAKSIGYEKLVQKCNELAETFGINTFKPTKSMVEGKITI